MPQIGSLASSAAVSIEASYLPQYLQVGLPNNADTLNSLQIQAFGESLINLNSANQIDTLAKLESNLIGAGANTALGKMFLLSNGRVSGASTIITIDNGSATTTAVYERSMGFAPPKNTLIRKVAVTPVVANGNEIIRNFDVIFMDPTNVDRVQVKFASGFEETLTPAELAGLYLQNFPGEGSGYIEGNIVIAGPDRVGNGTGIVSAQVFAGGSNVNVVTSRFVRR